MEPEGSLLYSQEPPPPLVSVLSQMNPVYVTSLPYPNCFFSYMSKLQFLDVSVASSFKF
jgi:hypothetical protein